MGIQMTRYCAFALLAALCICNTGAFADGCKSSPEAWIKPIVGEQIAMFNMHTQPMVGTNYGYVAFDQANKSMLINSARIVVDNKSAEFVRAKYSDKCMGEMTVDARFHIELRQESNRTVPYQAGAVIYDYYALVIDELKDSPSLDGCAC